MPDDFPLRGHFKLARQIAGCGVFAEVSLLIHQAASRQVILSSQLPPDTEFTAGAIFGASHALESLPGTGVSGGPFRVEITEIYSILVDSTEALVAYASARAVFSAFALNAAPMTLDPASRSITIPPPYRDEDPHPKL